MARCVHMKWVPVGEVPDHEQSVSEEAPDKALALASAGKQRERPRPAKTMVVGRRGALVAYISTQA